MQNYQCKQCGANIFWDPNEDSLKCGFCGSSYQPSDYEDLTLTTDENDATDKKAATDGLNQAEDDMVIYECGNCSGEVIALKTTMATICPYCGEAVSITSKAVGDFRPVKCLPFRIGKEKVKKLYKNYVKTTTMLAPSKFLAESEIEKIQGLYVPFYYNDIETHLNAGFMADKKTSTSNELGTEHITTTYLASLETNFNFGHIPVDASIKLNNDLMDALEPFPYEKCVPFNPAYMAGFLAEQADTEKEDIANRLERRLKTDLKAYIRRDLKQYYDYNSVSETPTVFDLTYGNYQTEYVMLPVWVLNIKYKNLRYKIAINGHTGEVVGKIPISKAKVALNWAAAFGVCSLVCAIITQLLFGGVSLLW